jgi:murein DD-endopeptidase MepM/ murein hydrolase activator NlpD
MDNELTEFDPASDSAAGQAEDRTNSLSVLAKRMRESLRGHIPTGSVRQWGPRLAAHVALACMALAAIWLARPQVQAAPEQALQPLPEQRVYTSSFSARGGARTTEDTLFYRAPVPHTTIPERPRKEVITYTVQYGDSLYGIASQFGISGNTLMWSNRELEENPDLLQLGQEVVILPVSGVYHKVLTGDTLDSIAKQYKVEPAAITGCEYNHLGDPAQIKVGDYLVVPGGVKPYVPRVVHAYSGPIPQGASKGSGIFAWPTSGFISQQYWELHRAIDIANASGTRIVAADSGYVAIVGSSDTGYGKYVVIDHGNGFQTLYAHFSIFYVKTGQSVKKGEVIGLMGSTGRSTGPHLHFEIRLNGVQRNPMNWLR